MPIDIKTPDGSAFSFPDGTSGDVIKGALDKHFGKSEPSTMGKIADFAKSVPGGAVEGLGEGIQAASMINPLSAIPAAIRVARGQPLINPALHKAVETVEKPVVDALPKPEGTAGEFGKTTGKFLGNPLSYLGPGGAAIKVGSAIAGAVGSEAAGQLTKGHPVLEPVGRFVGGLAGGAGVAHGADIARGLVTPNAHVSADLARAIQRDGDTPAALFARLERAQNSGQQATMADVGGENVRGILERVAQTPGAGRTTVIPALTQRQQAQMGRITDDLADLTGARQSATQAIEQTMAQRTATAAPIYEQAFNFNARQVPEIVQRWEQETSQGWGQQILNSPDFRRTLETEYGITDATNAPLMRVIDAWKKEADGMVGEAVRSGNNNRARVIGEMRDRLVGVVDQHNPAYAEARRAWAGPSRYLEAIEDGRNILSPRVSAEEMRANLAGMGEADQEAFRIGALSAIRGKMGNDPARMADMTKYLRAPEMRAKIAAIMPTPEAAESWANRLNFEVGTSELAGRSLGNSATARRLAEREDADGIMGDLVKDALSHGVHSIMWRALTSVPGRVRDTLRSRSDQVLGDVLSTPRTPAELRQTLRGIEQPPAATAGAGALRSALASGSLASGQP